MAPATETKTKESVSAPLVGLEAGMKGALAMLLVLGMAGVIGGRGFWSFANLVGAALRRDSVWPEGFELSTLAGAALWLLVYSLLGAAFAAVAGERLSAIRDSLLAVLWAIAWFLFSTRWLWQRVLPRVYFFYPEWPMAFGHLVWGICLARRRGR